MERFQAKKKKKTEICGKESTCGRDREGSRGFENDLMEKKIRKSNVHRKKKKRYVTLPHVCIVNSDVLHAT